MARLQCPHLRGNPEQLALVEERLAACVNMLPARSIYSWKDEVEDAREHLLLIKTTATRLRQLEREVKRLHTYEVPEFVALPIIAGSVDYLSWLRESVAGLRK